ncbi:hypothetical protein GGR50DRAFT_692180 [Xylaria sp. CBS 124048]|nr:hypothetical protein GGR50DRAFT_692180 [Xylaria sp. CBS 124048]
MKYTIAALAFAAAVSAQSLSEIPACAVPCIDDARVKNTNCAADDYKCLCDNINALTVAATTCVASACGPEKAVNEVLPAVSKFCDEVKKGGGSSSASAPTPAPAPTSSAPATSSSAAPTEATGYPTAPEPASSSGSAPASQSSGAATSSGSSPATESSGVASHSSFPATSLVPTLGGGNGTASSISSAVGSASASASKSASKSASATASSTASVSNVPTGDGAVVGSIGGLAMMVLGALAAF